MKMTEKQHVEHCHTLIAEWFKDHKAKVVIASPDTSGVVAIDWKRDNTWDYGCRFIISYNVLLVHGDLGEAAYAISGNMTLAKLRTFDWHYFWGKCTASETGRRYEQKIEGVKNPVVNIRAIAHFTGLQMAIGQLETQT